MKKEKKYVALKEKLKKEHKHYYTITVDEYECFLKKPSRTDMNLIMKITAKNEIKGIEYLFKVCWLGGDKEIKTEADLFLAAASTIETLFEVKEATIKPIENKQYEIKVDKYSCIIKKPSITDLSIIMSLSTKDPIKSNEEFLNRCWVSGDDIIKTEDELFFGVSAVLGDILIKKEATLKKS